MEILDRFGDVASQSRNRRFRSSRPEGEMLCLTKHFVVTTTMLDHNVRRREQNGMNTARVSRGSVGCKGGAPALDGENK
jgi:hypothetical protein